MRWYYYLLLLLAAWSLILLSARLVLRGSKKAVVNPLYILVKKELGDSFLMPVVNKRPVKFLGAVSVALASASMAAFYYYVAPISLGRISGGGGGEGGLTLIIPGMTVSWESLAYIILNLAVAASIHELAHAVIARSFGIRINSAGLIVAFVIPMAFVEPNEKEFRESSLKARVSTYSAGPAANLFLAMLILLLLSNWAFVGAGVLVTGVSEGSPAWRSGIEPGYVISRVNGSEVKNIADFQRALGNYSSIETYFELEGLRADGSPFRVVVHKYANESLLGISITTYVPSKLGSKVCAFLTNMLWWGYVVNFSLAIVNAAPIFITDGGRMVAELIQSAGKGQGAKALNFFVQTLTLLILLSSLTFRPIG